MLGVTNLYGKGISLVTTLARPFVDVVLRVLLGKEDEYEFTGSTDAPTGGDK